MQDSKRAITLPIPQLGDYQRLDLWSAMMIGSNVFFDCEVCSLSILSSSDNLSSVEVQGMASLCWFS
jgi:hypothetical protein